jgi:hypothetical protein
MLSLLFCTSGTDAALHRRTCVNIRASPSPPRTNTAKVCNALLSCDAARSRACFWTLVIQRACPHRSTPPSCAALEGRSLSIVSLRRRPNGGAFKAGECCSAPRRLRSHRGPHSRPHSDGHSARGRIHIFAARGCNVLPRVYSLLASETLHSRLVVGLSVRVCLRASLSPRRLHPHAYSAGLRPTRHAG